MSHVKKWIIGCLIVSIAVATIAAAEYIPSNKDTRMPPDVVHYIIDEPTNMQLLHETADFKFFFRESTDVIAIYDKRNQYTWKTGLDIEYDVDINLRCDMLLARTNPLPTDEEKLAVCTPLEDRLANTFEGIGNSLVTMQYFDETLSPTNTSTSTFLGDNSRLYIVNNDDSHYRLDVTFEAIDVSIKIHILFSNDGMKLEIRDEEITGKDTNLIHGFIFAPFMGAVGGQQLHFDLELNRYNPTPVQKPRIPGYVFVPDGPGALIRFADNTSSLSAYYGNVFGVDYSQDTYHSRIETNYIPMKNPTMPIYGIAHGDRQAAFIAHSTKGSDHLELTVSPHNNRTQYTYVIPKFVLNNKYTRVYNQSGSGYSALYEERNHFDIEMNYHFLFGDGSLDGFPADYVGMAKLYRKHLLDDGHLVLKTASYDQIPIRLDFVMSDAKKAIVGYQDVVVTKIEDVETILLSLKEAGVSNINSGLYGYQRGGIILGNKGAPRWSPQIGTYSAFKNVFHRLNDEGIDVSLAQNYSLINEEQMTLIGNAAKHLNGWYIRMDLRNQSVPITTQYFAKPTRSVSWLNAHIKAVASLQAESTTIEGMSDLLYSDHGNPKLNVGDTISLYQNAFGEIAKKQKINAINPNSYLWNNIDRYLQAPMFTSQYLIETDTVPFLQIVLNQTMEVYGPYSNFSFYTDSDILRMIDYNTYPSFVLTQESSYELMSTNSSNFYSTEYVLYEELILHVYELVNIALRDVIDAEWTDRIVLAPGFIKNTYDNQTMVLINYTDHTLEHQGHFVPPVSYRVIG